MASAARKWAWWGTAVLAIAGLAAEPAYGAEGWTWPVRGPVLTGYVNDNARPYAGGMHRGIDVGAPVGEQVVAARSGRVSFAGPLGSSGLVVAIETSDGRHATSYLHLGAIAVKRGEEVAAGARVGEVGTSGRRSTAEPHLHFGVRVAGSDHDYVDPLSLLPALPGPAQTPPAPLSPAPAPVRASPAPVPVAVPVRAPASVRLRAPRALPAPRAVPVAATRPAVRTGAPASVAAHARMPSVERPVPSGPAARLERESSRARPAPVPHRSRPRIAPGNGGAARILIPAGIALLVIALTGGRVRAAMQRAKRRAPSRVARPTVLGPAAGTNVR